MKRFLLLMSIVAACSIAAHAQIFTETFEGYSVPSGSLVSVNSPNTFGPWSVTAGGVEILNSFAGLPARNGTKNLDMDGGISQAGTITRTFSTTAGVTYTLTYYYSGSQRGDLNSMTVTLGTSSATHSNIPSAQGYTLGTVTFTAPSTGTASVTFAHTGGDNFGLLLDDITLSSNASGVPTLSEWGMIGLTALLILFGSLKAQRVNA